MVWVILLVFQSLFVPGVARYAYDTFIIGSQPDISFPVLRDMADVA